MIKIKQYLFLIFIFNVSLTYSQSIKGTVYDLEKKPLNAKIIIKRTNSLNIISEFVIVSKGVFSYDFKKSYSSSDIIVLEISSTGYSTYIEEVEVSKLKSSSVFNFILLKEKIEKLDEVIIKSKERPFSVKKDTVTFRVESYTDGTEKKVIDLLKKLPGIKVDENTNIIKYKGIRIETVTLEGDNLFGHNYSIGTKNINIDLIKEIEAIENYSENKLLKGIENTNKVSLNLKLKENKTDISINTELGVGYSSNDVPIDASINLLSISKKHKSFTVSTFNNIGKNKSPFNYSNNGIGYEQLKEEKYLVKKVITEYSSPNVTENNLSNINNEFFNNLNSIFNLSDKIKAKVNLYFIKDRININQFSKSNISIDNNDFTIFDDNLILKKPSQYRGDIELKYNTSQSSLLKYKIRFSNESINTKKTTSSNQNTDFSSFLSSKSIFINQNLEFTKKISNRKALQLNILNSTNQLDQKFSLYPSIFNNPEFNQNIQNIDSKKQNTSFKALFLGKEKKGNKYSFSVGYKLTHDFFESNLYNKNNSPLIVPVENSSNNLEYSKNEIYTFGSYNIKLGKFTISPNYSFRYLNQILKEISISKNSNFFIFEPSLNLAYKINKTSFISFDFGLNKDTASAQNLFANQVLIDYRIVKKNLFNLSLQKNQNFNLIFSKNDLFNQLELTFSANYLKQKGNFFTNTLINNNSTEITNFFLNENTDNLLFYFSLSKLIPSLKTNIKVLSNYSIFNYKNIVNNSELRDNKNINSDNSVFLKTVFNLQINFENKTTYRSQINRSTNKFINNSIENKFKIIFKPTKYIFATTTFNYLIPSLNNRSNNFSFLSSKVLYKPKSKKWELDLSGVNLLNQKFFVQENNTDISSNIFQTNLLGRYFLVNFNYSF